MLDFVKKVGNGELWNNYKTQIPKQKQQIYSDTRNATLLAALVGAVAGKYFSTKVAFLASSVLSAIVSFATFSYLNYNSTPSSALKWPGNRAGLTPEQLLAFNTSFDKAKRAQVKNGTQLRTVRTREIVNGQPVVQRKLQVVKGADIVDDSNLPSSLDLADDQAIVMSKEVVQTGATSKRKIRACHELFEGKKLVRKKCTSPIEEWFVKKAIEQKPRGIEKFVKYRERTDKKGNIVKEVISEHYPHKLSSYNKEIKAFTIEQRLLLIEDLIHGLNFIHTSFFLDENNAPRLFHSNIHPGHVLIKHNEKIDRHEAVLTDFRMDSKTLKCHFGYKSPETSVLYKKKMFRNHDSARVKAKAIRHNHFYGTKRDIWQLGLAIVTILAPNQEIPSIACLEEQLTKKVEGEAQYQREGRIGNITQRQIMHDLNQLKFSVLPKKEKEFTSKFERKERQVLEQLWNLARAMLRVDPNARFSAQQALNKITKIKALI